MSKQVLDGDTVATITPIFFGALVAVMREKNKQRTPLQAIGQLFVGVITAFYLAPPLRELLNIDGKGEHWVSSFGFVVGLIAYSILPTIMELSKLAFRVLVEKYGNNYDKKD